jgi:hypothetical protein
MTARRSRFLSLVVSFGAVALLVACGGNVVVDAPGTASGAGGAGGSVATGCPTPNPQPCNAVEECPCNDGTSQQAGCSNGFTCDQACCGHGGVQ